MVLWESQSQTCRLICYHLPLLGGDNLLAPGSRHIPHQISWHVIMIIKIPCHLVLGERLLITACKRIKVIGIDLLQLFLSYHRRHVRALKRKHIATRVQTYDSGTH